MKMTLKINVNDYTFIIIKKIKIKITYFRLIIVRSMGLLDTHHNIVTRSHVLSSIRLDTCQSTKKARWAREPN